MVFRLPSLHRFLLDVNLEIDSLYESYYPWLDEAKLNEFEVYVLILEDRRFLRHFGIDLRSVARELSRAMLLRKHGGASTIEMQFIRTVNNRKDRNIGRKLREMLVAFLVQFHFDKRAVLRSYLEQAFFGSGLTGSEAASQKAFSKSVSELTSHECALLASMLVYPMPLVPTEVWKENIKRRSLYALRVATRFEKTLEKIKSGESIRIR